MFKERGPSILEEEMARHGVKTKREDGELLMRVIIFSMERKEKTR